MILEDWVDHLGSLAAWFMAENECRRVTSWKSVWNDVGYGSIPMKIAFLVAYSHPFIYQLFWCEQKRGTIGFDTLPNEFSNLFPVRKILLLKVESSGSEATLWLSAWPDRGLGCSCPACCLFNGGLMEGFHWGNQPFYGNDGTYPYDRPGLRRRHRLSLYELGSTAVLVRTFTKEFVQQREAGSPTVNGERMKNHGDLEGYDLQVVGIPVEHKKQFCFVKS